MNYIFEALFVGLYSVILFNILFYFIKNEYILLFSLGFLKHYLAYYLKLQTLYCNRGYACEKLINDRKISHKITYKATNNYLFIESFIEGIWFLVVGSILFNIIGKVRPFFIIFLIGFFTHLISEKIQLHRFFCIHNCKMV